MQLTENKKEMYTIIVACIMTILLIGLGTVNNYILFIIPVIIILIILLENPKLWIYTLSIYFPFETVVLKFIPGNLAGIVRYGIEIISIIIFIRIIIDNFIIRRDYNILFKNKINKFIILFCLVSIISSILNHVELKISILGLRWFIRYVPLFYIVISQNWDEKEIKKYIKFMFYICSIQCIIGIMQIIAGSRINDFLQPVDISIGEFTQNVSPQGESKFAIFATMGRYSVLALFLSFWIPFMIAKLVEEKNKLPNKILLLLCVILNCFALVITYARQGVFGVMLGVIVISIVTNNKVFKFMISYWSLIIIGASIIILVTFDIVANDVSQGIISRFLGAFTIENIIFDISNYGRLYFMTVVVLKFLTRSPLLGFGIGMYGTEPAITYNPSIYYKLDIPISFSMDVFWTSIMGQVGILGIIFWVMIYVTSMKKALYLYKNKDTVFQGWFSLGYIGMLAVISLESFFSSNLNDRYQSYFFWVVTAFLVVLLRQKNINKDEVE